MTPHWKLPKPKSAAEEMLAIQIRTSTKLPAPTREHQFHPDRKWRFDFAWPEKLLAAEVDGVLWGKGGRHQRPAGYQKDAEKLNTAILLGWRVLRFTQADITSLMALTMIEQCYHKIG